MAKNHRRQRLLRVKASTRTRIAIVSPSLLDRDVTAAALSTRSDFDLVAVGGSVTDVATGGEPQVVLVCAPTGAVTRIAREAASRLPDARVVARVLSDNTERDVVASAEAGVMGFVTSESSLEELIGVMQSAARGELRYATPTAVLVLREFRRRTTPAALMGDPFDGLTPREQQILALLKTHSNRAIAQHLGIELATVKNHVHNVLGKLKLHRRRDAAAKLPAPPSRRKEELETEG